MPTYDYVCEECDHEFELFQTITDSPKRKCPECGRMRLRRLFGTGAAIVFKGSGFYQTDYRSDSYKKGAKKAEKAAEKSSGKKKTDDGSKGKSSSSSKDKKSSSSD